MPTSATGATEPRRRSRRASSRPAGFTLVEVLVVVVIAAVLTGLVVVGLARGGPAERAERELDRLSASLERLCDRALLTGTARGLRFHQDGYDFWILRGDWQRLAGEGAPPGRTWPAGMNPRVSVERVALTGRRDAAPQVVCTGLEPATAFEIALGAGENRRRMSWPR
ncbi:MAG: prepilin-type N-terminal cleavage/methylation domain-containing protein [Candidatus Wenzhouxiangella sp. M2_3B_020]